MKLESLAQENNERPVPDESSGRILLLACGALAREILALKELNHWNFLDLHCLPAQLHLTPEDIPDAVEKAILRFQDKYRSIFVVYADCGTGGLLQARCKSLGVRMLEGPHCYSFFDGNENFASSSEGEMCTFFLTDFLVRQFESFVIEPLGLDQHPELRDDYFGNYTKLAYLAQTRDTDLQNKARSAAEKLGLKYEYRFTGYGDLAVALGELD